MLTKLTTCTITLLSAFFLTVFPSYAIDNIQYVGSSTVGKFITEASKVYNQATFTINTRPESGGGESRVATGRAPLGGVARELSPEFVDVGLEKFLIGHDAIGAWVNHKNPVSDLSSSQLQKIFAGEITNWRDVGGSDRPINVYIVKANSATYKVFKKKIMGTKEYSREAQVIRPDQKIGHMIAADPYGIGQLSFALGDSLPEKNDIKKIAVDGQQPTVNNPQYPITRPLYLVTKGAPTGAIKKFIDWSLSPDGQQIVKKWFVGR